MIEVRVGDTVQHVKDPDLIGRVLQVDDDCYLAHEYGVTTCRVAWEPEDTEGDIQWTNKLWVLGQH